MSSSNNHMPGQRPIFEASGGGLYYLWHDINDVQKSIGHLYYYNNPEQRKKAGRIFRGQSNEEWGFLPNLFRPPFSNSILEMRMQHTASFIKDLRQNGDSLHLSNLTELKCFAIAQHYGLYTTLLDFTWNFEVAAWFASESNSTYQKGAIYHFNLNEYEKMKNPFNMFGAAMSEESAQKLKEVGIDVLPDIQLINFDDVPRINVQEGIFIDCPAEKAKLLFDFCIDRIYFNQKPGIIYDGQFQYNIHLLAPRRLFQSDEVYDSFLELAKADDPRFFDRTAQFGNDQIYPPKELDPISQFVFNWKQANPDPTLRLSKK